MTFTLRAKICSLSRGSLQSSNTTSKQELQKEGGLNKVVT